MGHHYSGGTHGRLDAVRWNTRLDHRRLCHTIEWGIRRSAGAVVESRSSHRHRPALNSNEILICYPCFGCIRHRYLFYKRSSMGTPRIDGCLYFRTVVPAHRDSVESGCADPAFPHTEVTMPKRQRYSMPEFVGD